MSNQEPPQSLSIQEDAIRYHEILTSFIAAGFTRAESIHLIAGIINTTTAASAQYQIEEHRRKQDGK